jgi:hypothetical protein
MTVLSSWPTIYEETPVVLSSIKCLVSQVICDISRFGWQGIHLSTLRVWDSHLFFPVSASLVTEFWWLIVDEQTIPYQRSTKMTLFEEKSCSASTESGVATLFPIFCLKKQMWNESVHKRSSFFIRLSFPVVSFRRLPLTGKHRACYGNTIKLNWRWTHVTEDSITFMYYEASVSFNHFCNILLLNQKWNCSSSCLLQVGQQETHQHLLVSSTSFTCTSWSGYSCYSCLPIFLQVDRAYWVIPFASSQSLSLKFFGYLAFPL